MAFAPFLPQIDVLGQYGVVSSTLAPGVPGNEGFILANGSGTRGYAETEVALQWTLYDFGRSSGRYRQAVARERITESQFAGAEQIGATQVLLFQASRVSEACRGSSLTLETLTTPPDPALGPYFATF